MILLLLFILIPFIELYLLLAVHSFMQDFFGTGVAWMVSLGTIFVTGAVGAHLARQQGFKVLHRLRQKLVEGKEPTKELVEGIMILAGGILLLAPGYLTDIVGLSCVIPQSRFFLREYILNIAQNLSGKSHFQVVYQREHGYNNNSHKVDDANIIDIEELK